MSNQPDQEKQPSEILTSEEMRQSILAEVEVSKQEIVEISNEQLMEITGGQFWGTLGHVAINACCDPITAAGSVGGAALGGITGAVTHGNIAKYVSRGSTIGSYADPFAGLAKGIGKIGFKGITKGIIR